MRTILIDALFASVIDQRNPDAAELRNARELRIARFPMVRSSAATA